MTDATPFYVVEGNTFEYEDSQHWIAYADVDRERAIAICNQLQVQADDFYLWRKTNREERWLREHEEVAARQADGRLLDACFHWDRTPTRYVVLVAFDDPTRKFEVEYRPPDTPPTPRQLAWMKDRDEAEAAVVSETDVDL